jgi:hypothetical protein
LKGHHQANSFRQKPRSYLARLDLAAANRPTARHFCCEAHAQVYISRWFESICSPAKPVMRVS